MKTPLQRRFLTVLCLLLSTFCVIAAEISPTGNILYVKKGATGNGSSWTNALGELSEALQWAQANKSANLWDASNPLKIYVAKGTYTPSINPVDNTPVSAGNQRDAAFLLVKDVQLYGGFAGTEATLAARDLSLSANASILSGDFNGDDAGFTNNGENAYHVVISAGAVGTAELNGFTLTGGNANSSGNITVNSQSIYQNSGGGIYNAGSKPVLANVSISTNTANSGGGICNSSSSPVLTNVTISANTVEDLGGGICNVASSSPILTNVTISANTATNNGGGICNVASSPVLTNVTISANTANSGGGIYNYDTSSKPQIRNSIIYGNSSGIVGGASVVSYSLIPGLTDTNNGNIDGSTDPQFVDAANGDYNLKNTSPLINKGDNTYFATGKTPDLSTITTDIAGNARIQKGKIDLGAYESSYSTPLSPDDNNVIYVTQAGAGNQSGNSWANATNDLQMAINATGVQQVWVAGGTYKPKYRADDMSDANANDRDNAFVLKKDVQLYGGFAGTETALTDRNLKLSTNASILSGDLGAATDNTDNAYHVVISAGAVGTAELNGFTLTGGNANNSSDYEGITVNSQNIPRNTGGGIYNIYSSPVLTHVSISGNSGNSGGGIYNSYSFLVLTHVSISSNSGNSGGGIYNSYSFPVLTHVSINQNTASGSGGGINNEYSNPVLTNVSISSNSAHLAGGGIANHSSSPVLTNVSISGNTANIGAGAGGGAMHNNDDDSKPQIRNSIIYDNNTGITGRGTPVISYSLVQGSTDTNNGNIAGSTDPQFVNAANGDYSLKSTSPLINKGDNTYFATGKTPDLSAITTDLAGNARIQKGKIDLGAYESSYSTSLTPAANNVIYVTETGNGDFTGNSWANATDDLQMAINATNVQQVWVAGGTYKPMYRADNMSDANANDRNNAFVLKKDVQVYGGFAGTETELTDRDLTLSTHTSILSGDFNGDDAGFTNNEENAYHVVISAGDVGTAELNGFTLTGGNANYNGISITVNSQYIYRNIGGGIFNSESSSPVLSNLTINQNTADYYGGGIYNGESSSPVLSNVTISQNTATYGGGIYNSPDSFPILSNITISANRAIDIGGGIYNGRLSSPVLTNVSISANTADGDGGGIYNSSSSPVLTNVSISANRATYGGSGMYNEGTNSNPQIRNSIIYGNDNTGIDGAGADIFYSLVQGLTDTNNGNMDGSTDPDFVDAANGDFSLKASSPAINAGSNALYIGLDANTKDLAGKARLIGTNIDMGAYENQDGALPVTLVNYTAKASGNLVKLQWQTAEEQNNKGFVIYRSGDNTLFTPIGEVPVTDNLQPTTYNFTDTNPLNGNNYYKLVQVDKDGTATELGIRTVTFNFPLSTFNLYPNPTTELVHSSFSSNSYNLLTIADLNGRVLQQLQIQAGESSITVSLADYPAGTYLLRFSGKDGAVIKKVVKR
ncbi:beta strand repeat-containing protein [Pseudopedobacter beijingensis]|uniref:Beta strand repeat-containing protein n=1 Tax=Pseudopedobacter beijingensis TaxID=1207056 RepID=A0ABW4IAR4_9SPHI